MFTLHDATKERWAAKARLDEKHNKADPMRDAHLFAQKANVGLLCREGQPVYYIFDRGNYVEGAISTLEQVRALNS